MPGQQCNSICVNKQYLANSGKRCKQITKSYNAEGVHTCARHGGVRRRMASVYLTPREEDLE